MIKRPQFNLMKSFWDAGKTLPDEMRLKYYDALLQYGFTQTLPEDICAVANALLVSNKPILDISWTRYLAKAGKTKQEQTKIKSKSNQNQNQIKQDQIEKNGGKEEGERKKEEGERKIEVDTTPQTPQGAGGMSYEDYYTEILDLYHEHCPSLSPIRNLNEQRKKLIRQRLSEGYTIADFAQVFRNTEADDFMTGKNERKWKANIDYILRNGKEDKFLKLLEATPTHITPTEPEPQYFEPANRSDILKVYPNRHELVDTPWSELTPDVQQVITEKCKEL